MPPRSSESPVFEAVVGQEYVGFRLDVYLADAIEDASRSLLKKLIAEGRVQVDGTVYTKPARMMVLGERVAVELPPPPPTTLTPENIPLDIVFQDADLVVVNKPPGLVVHPAPGHYTGTLVQAILYHCPDFGRPGTEPTRPGIVHRLDRLTSGVLVVAKTPRAFLGLSQQAREHTFDRRYVALVRGEFKEDTGRINAAVGRSLADPKRMSVTGLRGREAVTRFEVLERFGVASLVALRLETGRTHQIRVHLRFAQHPVLGDPVYGVANYSDWKVPEPVRAALEGLEGQALHAEELGLTHPATGERLTFKAPPPKSFRTALDALRRLAAPKQA